MIDRQFPGAWTSTCSGCASVVGLRLRTFASLCPRSGQYDLILTLPASLRYSILAAQDVTGVLDHLSGGPSAIPNADPLRAVIAGGRQIRAATDGVWIRRAGDARPPTRTLLTLLPQPDFGATPKRGK
jgi:hypothetical protein